MSLTSVAKVASETGRRRGTSSLMLIMLSRFNVLRTVVLPLTGVFWISIPATPKYMILSETFQRSEDYALLIGHLGEEAPHYCVWVPV